MRWIPPLFWLVKSFVKVTAHIWPYPFAFPTFLPGIKSNYETLHSTVHGVNHNFRGMKDRKLKQFYVKGKMCYMSIEQACVKWNEFSCNNWAAAKPWIIHSSSMKLLSSIDVWHVFENESKIDTYLKMRIWYRYVQCLWMCLLCSCILLKWLCSNARLLPLTIMTNDAPHIIWKKFDSSNYQKEEEIRSP